MEVSCEQTTIRDVVIVAPQVFEDERGFFTEVFRADKYSEWNLPTAFVQFNHSGSVKDTVRGLHFQWDPPMGKLMKVTRGAAFLVAVDIRKGSPTLGGHFAVSLSEKDRRLVWAPAGFARGFAVLSEYAEIQYLTTGIYNQNAESGIAWNDPVLGIKWPVPSPVLSGKDQEAQTLAQWLTRAESDLFTY
jgi:dTDP-4-dehydrorhamnose 3,5-epimerase